MRAIQRGSRALELIISGKRSAGRTGRAHVQAQLLVFVLELIEPVVNASLTEQFLMGALLAQASFVEDENAVGILDGAQAVRDDNRGASGEQPVQGFANHHFGFCIDAGGGFVEDQEVRIMRQGAGEAHELALADGKRGAALGDQRVQALGQAIEKGPEPYFAEGGLNGLAGYARRCPGGRSIPACR